ncbi:aldo/keto reductase [uncultured Fusobacterium sp.]|uniref:aldo/keto reductase n=1 Tax=uncultured Fusobacterium sp. TaxID=159267 RepID=UPI0025FA326F|nr:aldo/keto reductase [uncultured Fusobacterium sp.]
MKYKKLGNSDLIVSSICMGCMGFGDLKNGQHSWTIDEMETKKIIKSALELGINFYDTALAYQNGTSEEFTGKALRELAKRDEYIVATKFLPRSLKEIESKVSGQKHIENSINSSLKNLGLDYVDLYIYHMWDYNTPLEEIMLGLDNVIKSGKARAIGISNCFAWQLAKANYFARANSLTEFVSMQGHYNLIAREEEREMIPFCKEENIALTPYSALAGGRLAKYRGETSKRLEEDSYAKFKYDKTVELDQLIIDRVVELSKKYGVSMTEISLAWLLTKVTSPIVGATKVSQVEGMAKAVDLTLSDEDISYLEELYIPHQLVGVMAQNSKKS